MKKFTKPKYKAPVIKEPLDIHIMSEMIEISADNNPENIAFLAPGKGKITQYTYGQVLDRVRKLARHLKEFGLGKGDHIAILGENRPEWGISFFAVSWIGAVAIPLDARGSLESHRFIMSFSSTKAVITSGTYYNGIRDISDGLASMDNIILMDQIDDICSKYSDGVNRKNVSS